MAESLGLPEATHLNRRLFKKQFYELAKLNKAAKEQFAKAVENIVWTHTLKKGTINIPPLVTEKLEYIEVAYIHVEMTERTHFKKVAEVIHRIPYPVVLMMTEGDALCLSTAPKRINQSDTSRLTAEEYLYSEWIDLASQTTVQRAFLESLQLHRLSFENFHTFYQDICEQIVALAVSRWSGKYSSDNISKKKKILDKIQPLQEQIASLKHAIKKESQFNTKVRLNMQLKALEKQIQELANMAKGSR